MQRGTAVKITKEKLIDFIKEEIVQVLEQRQVTSSTVPKDNEERQKLVNQINSTLNSIPGVKGQPGYSIKRNYFATQRQKQREMGGFSLDFLKKMLPIAQQAKEEYTKKAGAGQAQGGQGGGDAILQNVIQRFPKANKNKEAIKKIIELQTMLVKLNLAAPKLKNGKPFVDGVLGRSTIIALKKLYR